MKSYNDVDPVQSSVELIKAHLTQITPPIPSKALLFGSF